MLCVCSISWHTQGLRLSSCACVRETVCVCDFGVDLSVIHYTAGRFVSLKGTPCCERAEKALPLPSSHLDSSSKQPSQNSRPGATGRGRNSIMTGEGCIASTDRGSYLKKRGVGG